MSWVKRLYFRQIAALVILGLLIIGCVPSESMAYIVGSNSVGDASSSRAADMESIQRVLELKMVSGKLESMGLSMSEIKGRLDKLPDSELHQFASRINSLAPGGDCGDCGIGVLVALLVIALLVYIIIKFTEHKIVVK